MPVSPQLPHADGVQAMVLQIEKRHLSTVDLYRWALSTMAEQLDTLLTHLTEEPGVPGRYIVIPLNALLDKVSTAVHSSAPRMSSGGSSQAMMDADLALAAYSVLRDGISRLYGNHRGALHSGQCLICRCLWLCATVIDATERTLTQRMKQAHAQLMSTHSGQPSHKAAPVPYKQGGNQRWHVTCPTCGIIGAFAINRTQDAARLAIRHRRERVAHSRQVASDK